MVLKIVGFAFELLDLGVVTIAPDFSSNLALSIVLTELSFVGRMVDKEFALPIISFWVLSCGTTVDEEGPIVGCKAGVFFDITGFVVHLFELVVL